VPWHNSRGRQTINWIGIKPDRLENPAVVDKLTFVAVSITLRA
jgi:hypothetical protein